MVTDRGGVGRRRLNVSQISTAVNVDNNRCGREISPICSPVVQISHPWFQPQE